MRRDDGDGEISLARSARLPGNSPRTLIRELAIRARV